MNLLNTPMKKTIKEKLIWTDSRYRLGKIGQHTRLSIHSANLWIGYNITSVKITLTNPREREAMEEAIEGERRRIEGIIKDEEKKLIKDEKTDITNEIKNENKNQIL